MPPPGLPQPLDDNEMFVLSGTRLANYDAVINAAEHHDDEDEHDHAE